MNRGLSRRRPLVLVVDDTPADVHVLADALDPDYDVAVVSDGGQALDVAVREQPDAILLEVAMPGMDGYQVCRRLKAQSVTRDIPVIFVASHGDAMAEEYGLDLGAVDYIVKPFTPPIVRARTRTQVNLKRRTDLLKSLALVDSLTGIANRRRFDEALEAEWKRARRNGRPLALVMADVDWFKRFNDCYGHGAGDECLRRVAGIFAGVLSRPGDLTARYGGEEFACLLPDTDLDGAAAKAEEIRAAVHALSIPHEASDAAAVTVSLGVAAAVPAAEQAPDTLFAAADARLYQAKRRGRNRVCDGAWSA